MGRKHEAERLLRSGLSPVEIAKQMRISFASVTQYLRTRVGEGALRLSDIYFSFPAERRKQLQQAADTISRTGTSDSPELLGGGKDRDELELFISLRQRRVFAGDLYELVSETELTLHQLVRDTLIQEFGSDESGWWRKGIPNELRIKCATRREEDHDPSVSAYCYTDLIDLGKIMFKNWNLFVNVLPTSYRANRKKLESDFALLNRIRNSVMHPVKERKWSEADFEFVRGIRETFRTTAAADDLPVSSTAGAAGPTAAPKRAKVLPIDRR